MTRIITIVCIAAFAMGAGCKKKPKDNPDPNANKPAQPTPDKKPETATKPVDNADKPTLKETQPPVATDFEDEATAKLTKDTKLDDELSKLDKEIGSDNE